MKERTLKYIFYGSAFLLFVIMLYASTDAGISCDEILHYDHSVAVCNYFASGGNDKSALDTPVTNLKYYGQAYDNIVTIITQLFRIEDVYLFRNLMSAVMGWCTVMITALFATWLRNVRTGILVIFLFAITPAFIGHSYNNLKDIPFAFAYIAGIFFILRFLSEEKIKWPTVIYLILSFAFCIGIRAGGLLLICYLFLFLFSVYALKYFNKTFELAEFKKRLYTASVSSIASYFLSIILWPFAIQNPLVNIFKSYRIMAHYPLTFRQLFEGKVEWTDFMPWYYLYKSMLITIPIVVFAGLILFLVIIRKAGREKASAYIMLAFTVIFPLVFVIAEKSNLYSSWRQFLFVFPGIVLLSASGFVFLFEKLNKKALWIVILLTLVMSVHPVKYMIRNHPYEYIYYNELTGGLNGAYTRYETDYYYTSQTEASKWLISYLRKNNINKHIEICATYPVNWNFRKLKNVHTSFIRYEERSMHDWDYAIVGNRYIPPFQLKNGIFPPQNSIHIIYADTVPICAVLKRKTKDDFLGYKALKNKEYADAIRYFEKAIPLNDKDELVFYNYAGALVKSGRDEKADSMLRTGLQINPVSEPILMYLGNIAKSRNDTLNAAAYYEKVLELNRKYFEAYVNLSALLVKTDIIRARNLLRDCLELNPLYKPALTALGDTYKDTDMETARKYYEKARNIN
jgi:tetratricopeptide (TPR) repeat protein